MNDFGYCPCCGDELQAGEYIYCKECSDEINYWGKEELNEKE